MALIEGEGVPVPCGLDQSSTSENVWIKILPKQIRATMFVVTAKIKGNYAIGACACFQVRQQRRPNTAPLMVRIDDQWMQFPTVRISADSANPTNQFAPLNRYEAKPIRIIAHDLNFRLGFS